MRYQLFGRSGLRVSELCLGTMTFGEDWGWGASEEVSRSIFNRFAEAGGNFIDSACNYTNGTSETFVGKFTQPERGKWVIATKYTLTDNPDDPNAGGNHRKNMVQSLEKSLRRLQTDYVDLLWLHMWDGTTPVEEVLRGLDDLVRAGKVLYLGISDTPAWVVSRANAIAELRGWSQFVGLQLPYSVVDRAPERELLPMAEALGLSVTTWGVLAGGALTGKYKKPSDEPKRYDEASEKELAGAEELDAVAKEIGRTPTQVAINWVRQRGSKMIPILGARTVAQIQDNLGCLDFQLSPESMKRLDGLRPPELGFPHSFLSSDMVKNLIFGKTYEKIVLR